LPFENKKHVPTNLKNRKMGIFKKLSFAKNSIKHLKIKRGGG